METPPPTEHIPFIRISLSQSDEKRERMAEKFAQALADSRGNQVHLAVRMEESDRLIRATIQRARLMGFDIPQRAIEIMREKGIEPWVPVPPLRTGPRKPADAVKLSKATARRDAGVKTRAAKKAKKKPRPGTSASRPA